MKEFKGTKGRWEARESYDKKYHQKVFAIDSYFDQEVLNEELITVWEGLEEGESKANAKLIASAPQLLEALQKLIESCDDVRGWKDASSAGKFDARVMNAENILKKSLG